MYKSGSSFYIFLTVHLDVMLVNNQLDALFLNVSIFILHLYMFRAAGAHHQEVQSVSINTFRKSASTWKLLVR